MLTPCINALQSMGWNVDILFNTAADDPRSEAFKDIINNYPGIGSYKKDKQYEVGFYVWGEGDRKLPTDNVKEWKITKESADPIKYFLSNKHEVELNMTIARHLGYKGETPNTYCSVTEMKLITGWPQEPDDSTNICIHVGSRPEVHWKKKRWLNNSWVDLLKKCLDKKYNIHILYHEWEVDDVNDIEQEFLNISSKGMLIVHRNYSVLKVAYLISKCDLMISTDSGPMHIANAVGTPVIQLFGPTLLTKNRVWNKGTNLMVRDEGSDCIACLYTDKFNTCTDNVCMKGIKPERIFDYVEKILERKAVAVC